MKSAILSSLLLLICAVGFSQSNAIRIEFLGNCGLYLTDETTDIYTDFPYKSGAYGYMEYDASELDSIKENSLFIFTHKHADHYSSGNINKVIKEKGGNKYGAWNIEALKNLEKSVPNFSIEVFKTKHKWSCKHYSYLITWHGKRIYLSGDTESAATIGTMRTIDWAFVPYWILKDANAKGIKIDAKMIGMYHLATVQIPSARKNSQEMENLKPMIEQGGVFYLELDAN